MEKLYFAEKSASFLGRHYRRRSSDVSSPKASDLASSSELSHGGDSSWREHVEDADHHDVGKVSEDVDQFAIRLSTVDDKSNLPEVPESVETFAKIIEWRIAKYYSADLSAKFGKMTAEDLFFLEAVRRITKLIDAFGDFPAESTASQSLNRTTLVLQRAMLFLEDEFRDILEDCINSVAKPRIPRSTRQHLSFNARLEDSNRGTSAEVDSPAADQDFPSFTPEVVKRMSRIASAMISAGYETECCQVFTITRRIAFNEFLKSLDYDPINMEEVHKMHWEPLEGEIVKWIKVVKHCVKVLFPGERKFCDAVFSQNSSIAEILFSDLARVVMMKLLIFAEAVLLSRRSSEKLFKYVDMYEVLRDLVPFIKASCSEDCARELVLEVSAARDHAGESAVHIFCDLENSIKGDAARTPVPGGAIHPLTRYVMNYLKYASEYKDLMEDIFEKNKDLVRSISLAKSDETEEILSPKPDLEAIKSSPFAEQLMTAMKLLDANLEAKANLYRDPSLRCIFLMNNGRYILQKIKGSSEILQLVGDTYYRVRSTVVRRYHKNYQRETCGKLLQFLNQEGLQVNGKVNKPLLKERFKGFNNICEDIHRTQSAWVVSDAQLQSELRVAVAAIVIPAYRSFLGRFRQCLVSGKHPEKYIKYQPEDLEALIEELYEGNTSSMSRRRDHIFFY